MSITKFTPGPWTAEQDPEDADMWGIHAEPPFGGAVFVRIATVEPPAWNSVEREQLAANACLIAAAPELLAALERAERKLAAYVGVCAGDKELTDAVLPMARAAIAKARGDA